MVLELLGLILAIAISCGLIFAIIYGVVSMKCHFEKKIRKKSTSNDEISVALSKAYEIAKQKGLLHFFFKNKLNIAAMARIHKGNQNIIDAEIYYFVYGIHERVEKEAVGLFKGELFDNIDFLQNIHMPIISTIVDTPPKSLMPSEYVDMIFELIESDNDSDFLAVFDKYNYEYPERIKKMLSNDVDVLAETAFYSVAKTIQSSNVKYFNNGIVSLDFILYYYAIYRCLAFSEITDEQKKHFDSSLRKHFVEYAEMWNIFESRLETSVFCWERYATYKKLIKNDEDSITNMIEELVAFANKKLNLPENSGIYEKISEMMVILDTETKAYFVKLLEAYETNEISSLLDNTLELLREEIKDRKKEI